MLKNYLIVAFRNIKKHKGYSLINIGGLAVVMACFLIILLFVRFELSFDDFHKNGDQIYRFYKKREVAGTSYLGNDYFITTPAILAPTLKEDFPEVVNSVRVNGEGNRLLSCSGKQFYQDGIYADQEFLEMFTFPLVRGSQANALVEPFSIILTESLAAKIFGDADPLDFTCQPDLLAHRLLCHAPLAPGICLQNQLSVLDLRPVSRLGPAHRPDHCQLPVNQGCHGRSGGFITV